jgi:hypothetical protein
MRLVDLVWLAARDGRWHTIEDLVEYVPLRAANLVEAVSFLVKYQFAEWSSANGGRFRMVTSSPSPLEVADSLQAFRPKRVAH